MILPRIFHFWWCIMLETEMMSLELCTHHQGSFTENFLLDWKRLLDIFIRLSLGQWSNLSNYYGNKEKQSTYLDYSLRYQKQSSKKVLCQEPVEIQGPWENYGKCWKFAIEPFQGHSDSNVLYAIDCNHQLGQA